MKAESVGCDEAAVKQEILPIPAILPHKIQLTAKYNIYTQNTTNHTQNTTKHTQNTTHLTQNTTERQKDRKTVLYSSLDDLVIK